MGQHQVVAVTVVTGGCHNQTRFKQAPAMDALGIVFHDVVFRYIVYSRYYLTFSVTFSAEIGDIHLIGAGLRVGIEKDIVVSVALFTTGGIGVIP